VQEREEVLVRTIGKFRCPAPKSGVPRDAFSSKVRQRAPAGAEAGAEADPGADPDADSGAEAGDDAGAVADGEAGEEADGAAGAGLVGVPVAEGRAVSLAVPPLSPPHPVSRPRTATAPTRSDGGRTEGDVRNM
jgi:hypothetical protein